MGLDWTPWFILPLVSLTMAIVVATPIFSLRPSSRQHRALAANIVLLSLTGTLWSGVIPHSTTVTSAHAATMLQTCLYIASIPAYILFLSTMSGPVARTLNLRMVRVGVIAAALIVAVSYLARPEILVVGYETTPSYWNYHLVGAPGRNWLDRVFLGTALLGLVVAWQNYKAAPTPGLRRQGLAYLIAFGVRDVLLVALIIMISTGLSSIFLPWWADALSYEHALVYHIGALLIPVGELIFFSLLAYGVLKSNLFDIDLKIKLGIRRGTVATIFIAVFYVVAVTAENFLTDRFDWALGGVVAGLLLFAIAPLQRFGERVANAAMPNVQNTSEYTNQRKREVYQDAYAGMLADGLVTEKEKDVLARLATSLELLPTDVREIERGVA